MVERIGLGAHAAHSSAIRPRIPFTSRAASGDAYRFASPTASEIATSGGTVPPEVAISEAVGLAKRYASPEAARLVNGILGRIAEECAA